MRVDVYQKWFRWTFLKTACVLGVVHMIAVHRRTRADRSPQAARELAKKYFKLRIVPNDDLTTSLDELDKVERNLNQELLLSDWQGISVYEPERKENGEILWHLRRNPSNKLKNIITSEFTIATRFERASHKLVTSNDTKKFAHEEEHLTIVQTEKSKRRRQFIRERSIAKLKLQHH